MSALDEKQQDLAAEAEGAILGANPFVGLDRRQLVAAAGRLLGQLGLKPDVVASEVASLLAELGRVLLDRSDVEPDRKDRRFTDPTWASHPVYRRLGKGYLAARAALHQLVDESDLDPKSADRAHFAVTLLVEALAPTNTLVGNPAAIKRAFETGGISLLKGLRNFAQQTWNNRGMPRTVDTRPFTVGETIATSDGAVVYRDEVLELIQYRPTTQKVRERPLVYMPPQINKYYIMDLAPGRSWVEYAVGQGLQVFAVSWRNPTAEQRAWDLDTYLTSVLGAIDAARGITGSEDVNLMGLCAGGITMSVLMGHLAAKADRRVHALTYAVTFLDTSERSMVGMFASERSISAAIRRSQEQGVLKGREMERVFSWLRPNDLVWNYWVNNYLMGEDPPAFDVLYWNQDSTRLPAGLHADFLGLFANNSLNEPGAMTALGTAIDLSKVDNDAYVVAGITDHITPWAACYRTTQLLGGETEFILSTSGHIQSLVNPVDNPKSKYRTAPSTPSDPQEWFAQATEHTGSWWAHWQQWIDARSGKQTEAPDTLGSERYPALEPAPGRYVHQR